MKKPTITISLIPLTLLLLFIIYLYYCVQHPSPQINSAKDTLPATLYRTDAEPVNVLAEKTWHLADQIVSSNAINGKNKVDNSTQHTFQLPTFQAPNNNEPITIAIDYSGLNATTLKPDYFRKNFIIIDTSIGCPTNIEQCGIKIDHTIQDSAKQQSDLRLDTEFIDSPKLSNEEVWSYGGWLYIKNERIESHFVYHQLRSYKITHPNNVQISVQLRAPKGINTDYLKVTVVQGNVSYTHPPTAFAHVSGGKAIIESAIFRDIFTLLMVGVVVIFAQLYRKFGKIPYDGPKIFSILLMLWGTFLFYLGWQGILGVTVNDLIALGALITCAGTLMLFRVYLGLIVLMIAMITAWLIAYQLTLTTKDLFARTGLITIVTAYAFFSPVRDHLD